MVYEIIGKIVMAIIILVVVILIITIGSMIINFMVECLPQWLKTIIFCMGCVGLIAFITLVVL